MDFLPSKDGVTERTARSLRIGPQLADTSRHNWAITAKEVSARDFSEQFRERVKDRFLAVQSIKQTARDFSIPARVVSEILHLTNFRRGVQVMRRSA